ncbi:hypothetical protein [Evansella tamaricis]|uniref:Uncharacterized protein n=1 Tax=Evansella tamaricis TaxID=2069301 RepID=A0ABS6JKU7_9BACI|nr:hypothetical protein [Evansella tamaricis]MBU9714206.1 hypothetical protein [Evansella tamaricis]
MKERVSFFKLSLGYSIVQKRFKVDNRSSKSVSFVPKTPQCGRIICPANQLQLSPTNTKGGKQGRTDDILLEDLFANFVVLRKARRSKRRRHQRRAYPHESATSCLDGQDVLYRACHRT